ncbi:SsrA-binding protein SmpB [Granulosicoccaceae sp. 1_MG-2023]|nr:SsrA-binding protein SmpB [Granulosicoccaceae sp. 1_MG-2023]
MSKQKKSNKKGSGGSRITENRRARYDYQIEENFEAGLSLMGWEVKSLRDGRVQLNDTYVMIRNGEAWLVACQITPLLSASTHVDTNPTRARKLLLHRRELNKLIGMVERKGYTLVPLAMYWKNGRVKLDVGLGKGKKEYDKRATEKARDWSRDKQRIMRRG